MKIRSKLLVFGLGVGILPFMLVAAVALLQSDKALRAQAFSQLDSLREAKKTQVETYFNDRLEDVGLLMEMVVLLRNNAMQKLQSVQANKKAALESFFKERFDNLIILAENELVSQALEQYDGAIKMEGSADGMAWQSIDASMGSALQKIHTQYDYYDLFLIAKDGTIVYSAERRADLGQNLLSGELQTSSLRRAFERGQQGVVLEDFAPYPMADGQHVAFFAAPVFRFGELSGTVVLGLPSHGVTAITERRQGMGNSGETYLVGHYQGKSSYRSPHKMASHTASFGQALGNSAVESALDGDGELTLAVSSEGAPIIRAYDRLRIQDLDWFMVSQVELEEAITPKLADASQDFFGKYVSRYDYYDLLLVHPSGHVFYSVQHKQDYGSNLFTDDALRHTHLAKLLRQTMDSKTAELSDFRLYLPSHQAPAAFIANPLLSAEGEVELVVIVQLRDTGLDPVMQERAGLGETGETYLVGEDGLMRSNSVLDPQQHSMHASLDNPVLGRVDTLSVAAALRGESGHLIGKNYQGRSVLSAYSPVTVGNMRWALVADIGTDEALRAVRETTYIQAALALGLILLVWVFVNRFSGRLVEPLHQVNQHLKVMARGRLAEDALEYRGRDEVAEIVKSAEALKNAFRTTIAQADAIAEGDYSQEVNLLSAQDQLGTALQKMTRTLQGVITQANHIAAGDYSREVHLLSARDQLGEALRKMTLTLRDMTTRNEEARRQLELENQQKSQQDWVKSGQTELNEHMSGDQNIPTLGKNVITFLARYLSAQMGTFYLYRAADVDHDRAYLKLIATYAYKKRKGISSEFEVGEGLVGQAALERDSIVVSEVPADYTPVQSSLGSAAPANLAILPFLYEDGLKGIIELGRFKPFDEIELNFLEQVLPAIATAVNTCEARTRMAELLQQSQVQAEELQAQAEELQSQQEELRQTNEELEQRTRILENQQTAIQQQNSELEKTRSAIEQKARELELASKYKSEFLANMSHELRTPLNSMLIMAQMLEANRTGNLTEKQVEFARTMHSAGSDLLKLINEILDLAKVEAGRLDLHCEAFTLSSLVEGMQQKFGPVAEDKGLNFVVEIAPELPPQIVTDPQRLKQVVTNLLSNALKFTDSGGRVSLRLARPAQGVVLERRDLDPSHTIAISVTDTGIGIPKDKQRLIFEAFHQADGSTSRRYGGTGLGLSISRELTQLLGCEMQLDSEEDKGSTFTLYVPEQLEPTAASRFAPQPLAMTPRPSQPRAVAPAVPPAPPPLAAPPAADTARTAPTAVVTDDRDNLGEGDKVLLIIEDDHDFSKVLQETAHEKNFKCLQAYDGKEGLEMAQQYQPQAIILDVGLPQVDGWTVMERLKDNAATRHIPVHFISGGEDQRNAYNMGAIGYLMKPVSMGQLSDALQKIEGFVQKQVHNVLLASPDPARQSQVKDIIGTDDVSITLVKARADILSRVRDAEKTASCFDCLVLDVALEGGGGLSVLEDLRGDELCSQLPVIIYSERELSAEEEALIQASAEKLTVKAVRSPERLLEETTLFLHQVESKLPQKQQQMLRQVHDKEAVLMGKRILLADDDSRNVFALGAVLEEKGVEVLVARNGEEALETLAANPDTDLVLMDIMMPKVDGYQAMQQIRKQERFRKLPIIALTAKAMKGDRSKCIDAGANDYLSKPIDTAKLLSLLRVWLYR